MCWIITGIFISLFHSLDSLDLLPHDPVVKVGSGLNLTCKLQDPSLDPRNISFSYAFHSMDRTFSKENIKIMDTSTVLLSVEDAREGTYYCDHNPPVKDTGYSAQYVKVGYPPDKATISCISHNFENLTCSWTTGRDTMIDTEWTASESNDSKFYKKCASQGHSCTLKGYRLNYLGSYWFKVKGRNKLGDSTSVAEIDILMSVKLEPVRNAQAVAVNNSMIRLSWQASPSRGNLMEDYILSLDGNGMQYSISYGPMDGSFTEYIYLNGSRAVNKSIYLTNVAPSIHQYNISIAGRPLGGIYWSDAVVVACGNATEDISVTPSLLPKRTYVSLIVALCGVIVLIVFVSLGLCVKKISKRVNEQLEFEVPENPFTPDICEDTLSYTSKSKSYTIVSNSDSGLVQDGSSCEENTASLSSIKRNSLSSVLESDWISSRDQQLPLLYATTNSKINLDNVFSEEGCYCSDLNETFCDCPPSATELPEYLVWEYHLCPNIQGMRNPPTGIKFDISPKSKVKTTPQGYSRLNIRLKGSMCSSGKTPSEPSSCDTSCFTSCDTGMSPGSQYIPFTHGIDKWRSFNTSNLTAENITTGGGHRAVLDESSGLLKCSLNKNSSSPEVMFLPDINNSDKNSYTKFCMLDICKTEIQDGECDVGLKDGYVGWRCLPKPISARGKDV